MNDIEAQEERRRAILQWLYQRNSLSIAELVQRFAVSRMTVHRDLDYLVAQGAAHKRHGWVELVDAEPGAASLDGRCEGCRGAANPRTTWVMECESGHRCVACCPGCGLHLFSLAEGVRSVQAREFLYGRMVDAKRATYVAESRIHFCCRPSLLVFGDRADGIDFQRGYGGRVASFHEALTYVHSAAAPERFDWRPAISRPRRAEGLIHQTAAALEASRPVFYDPR